MNLLKLHYLDHIVPHYILLNSGVIMSPTNNRGAMAKLYTAYHNVLKLFMGLSKYDRNSPLCVYTNVPNCPALIRKIVYRFKCRIEMSDNAMISALQTSGTLYSSSLHRKWRELLYVNNS